MKITNILSISGKSGLHELKSTKNNGIIVRNLEDDSVRFISSRNHAFSMLENITVYTQTDTIPLKEVFERMLANDGKVDLPHANGRTEDLRDYFLVVVPEHDVEKVYTSDIKKIIRWYSILKEKDLLSSEETPSDATEETSEA
ncbi:MAG: DUF5606 domain-containing protein [Chitinophagales bacterium]|nr:DUF5606 domain-containing protein [Bacteroidota bacterium]MCB9044293.1 DUF5606 domain-containing protein [Chitinophagales bacterium]